MFTSRAEYRILLRQDNADIRLTPLAQALGVSNMDERMKRVNDKLVASNSLKKYIEETSVDPDQVNNYLESINSTPLKQKVKLLSVLLRPDVSLQSLSKILPHLNQFCISLDDETILLTEVALKYEGYIKKEQDLVDKMERLESVNFKDDLDFNAISSLSIEAKEKLTKSRPRTIGQASRISGVSPSDISILLVHLGR